MSCSSDCSLEALTESLVSWISFKVVLLDASTQWIDVEEWVLPMIDGDSLRSVD